MTYLLQTMLPDKIMLQNALVMTTCRPGLPHNYSQVYRKSFVTALHRISAFSQCSLADLIRGLRFETLADSQQSQCVSSEHWGLKQCGPSATKKQFSLFSPRDEKRKDDSEWASNLPLPISQHSHAGSHILDYGFKPAPMKLWFHL